MKPNSFFAALRASISMRQGWILQVVSHLCSSIKSVQIPVAVYLLFPAEMFLHRPLTW